MPEGFAPAVSTSSDCISGVRIPTELFDATVDALSETEVPRFKMVDFTGLTGTGACIKSVRSSSRSSLGLEIEVGIPLTVD